MKISVTKYGLTPDTADGGTKGSYGMETLSFSFSPEWDTLAKSITFYPPHSVPICVYLEKNEIPLPFEVTQKAGKTSFVICGTNKERTILTVTGTIEVRDTINPTEREAGDYTPSAITIITQACEDAKASAERAKQAADAILARGAVMTMQYVDKLPEKGETDVLYLVPSVTDADSNRKNEYLYIVKKPARYAWQYMGEPSEQFYVYTDKEKPTAQDVIYVEQGTAISAFQILSYIEEEAKMVIKNPATNVSYTCKRATQRDVSAEYEWEKIGSEDDLHRYEKKMNKTGTISAASTEEQYPSAKAVYDALEEKASILALSSIASGKVSNHVVYDAVHAELGEIVVSDGEEKLIGSGTNIATLNRYGITKLNKPKTEGSAGQYLISDGDGGTQWTSASLSYSREEADEAFVDKSTFSDALEEKASLQYVSSAINNMVSNAVVGDAASGESGEIVIADGENHLVASGTNIATLNGYGVSKLDKPSAEGSAGQYLVSDGAGGSMWKTFDNSYTKTESDARYAPKGEAGGAENGFSVITSASLPTVGEENKLYIKAVPGAEDYGHSYEKNLCVMKTKQPIDTYSMWSNVDGPAYVYTTVLRPKVGDMTYYGNDYPNPTTLSEYSKVASVSDDGMTLTLNCGDTSTFLTERTITLTNYKDIPAMAYERIGEKPWRILLDFTASSSNPKNQIAVNKDIGGNSFSISEIEIYFKFTSRGSGDTDYADRFVLTENGSTLTNSDNYLYKFTPISTSTTYIGGYGSLRMNKNPIMDGWSGMAAYGTTQRSGDYTTQTAAAYNFANIGDLTRFTIYGINSTSSSTTAKPFYTGARFVVRGR